MYAAKTYLVLEQINVSWVGCARIHTIRYLQLLKNTLLENARNTVFLLLLMCNVTFPGIQKNYGLLSMRGFRVTEQSKVSGKQLKYLKNN